MNPLKPLLLLVGAAIVLPWDIALIPGPVPRINLQTENTGPLDEPNYTRESVLFPSVEQGLQLEAWVYRPKHPAASPPPVVVMGHGLVSRSHAHARHGARPVQRAAADSIAARLTIPVAASRPRLGQHMPPGHSPSS
jgi:hypothetical protein